MIVDVSNEIYDRLKTELTGVTVLKAYPKTVPTFPCVVVSELVNTAKQNTKDSGGYKHCIIAFEIKIFSNKDNARTEVKNIRSSGQTASDGQ